MDDNLSDGQVTRSAQLLHRHPLSSREVARHKEGARRGGSYHWTTTTAMCTLLDVAGRLPHQHLERAQPRLPLGGFRTIVDSDVVDFKPIVDLQRYPLLGALVADAQRVPAAILPR